ncbi:MAG: DNA cytosine methyltransferase [Candidatus Jordarchaeaceae archaeon]
MNKPTVVDLFCGAGGLSIGFEMAGFEIIAGIDIEKSFLNSFKNAHPNAIAIKEDLNKNKLRKVLKNHEVNVREIQIVIGGPPCQGFSTVGNRMIDDPRNNLVREFARAVNELKPLIFLMENVPGLASMKNGIGEFIVDELLKLFESIGYKTDYNLLTAADYGVPQLRKRLFFVGIRNDLDVTFSWPEKTHFPKNFSHSQNTKGKSYITVREAISDLPSMNAGEEKTQYVSPPLTEYQKWAREGNTKLCNHRTPNHSKIVLERIQNIPPGGNHSTLPEKLKLKSGYPNIYGRLKWDEPADTITGNFGCASAPGRFIHPKDNRVLSVREGARLQSFPDKIVFFGSLSQQYKQVGNAVPPLLSKAIASSIKLSLEKVLK